MTFSLTQLLGWLFRRAPVQPVRRALATAEEAGITIDPYLVEAHALAGGDAEAFVHTVVAARKAGVTLSPAAISDVCLTTADPLPVLTTPNSLPASQRPKGLLRAQADSDPEAAEAYVRMLIDDYNRAPAVLANAKVPPPGRGSRAQREHALLLRLRTKIAEEIARVLPHVPPAARATLPALARDV